VKFIKWITYDGATPPAFSDGAIVEVTYRNGVRRQGHQPWLFAGWNWHGTDTDITAYRVLK
jgi:hypothetical protein